jgi:hypothetical protein
MIFFTTLKILPILGNCDLDNRCPPCVCLDFYVELFAIPLGEEVVTGILESHLLYYIA